MPAKEKLDPSVEEKKPLKEKKSLTRRSYKKKSTQKKTYGILIVEDEKSWKNVYKINLFKQVNPEKKNFEFYEASNRKEALKILVQYYDRIQVVIIDLVMEETSEKKLGGMLLLETLVDRLGLNLGIFMITAYGTQEHQEQAYLRGVRGFFDKSQLDFEKLSILIDNYLDIQDKEKAIDLGIYAESRVQDSNRYLYIRWKHSDKTWDYEYISNMNDIERITLPNIITDLKTLPGLIDDDNIK